MTDPSTSSAEASASATTEPCSASSLDCKEAVEELYEFLSGELTDDKRASIRDHLDACAPCLQAYEFHADLKSVISEKCKTELPTGLRDRVFDALRALDS